MEHPEKERLLSRMRAGRRARRAEALPQRPGTTNLAFHGRSFAERLRPISQATELCAGGGGFTR